MTAHGKGTEQRGQGGGGGEPKEQNQLTHRGLTHGNAYSLTRSLVARFRYDSK